MKFKDLRKIIKSDEMLHIKEVEGLGWKNKEVHYECSINKIYDNREVLKVVSNTDANCNPYLAIYLK
ncbi:MAG: hypothetical protein NC087_05165 [Anaeroplasma bactoclasticum]|nr:hypothetical protein [Anaeroplasma bactoclasticum]